MRVGGLCGAVCFFKCFLKLLAWPFSQDKESSGRESEVGVGGFWEMIQGSLEIHGSHSHRPTGTPTTAPYAARFKTKQLRITHHTGAVHRYTVYFRRTILTLTSFRTSWERQKDTGKETTVLYLLTNSGEVFYFIFSYLYFILMLPQ